MKRWLLAALIAVPLALVAAVMATPQPPSPLTQPAPVGGPRAVMLGQLPPPAKMPQPDDATGQPLGDEPFGDGIPGLMVIPVGDGGGPLRLYPVKATETLERRWNWRYFPRPRVVSADYNPATHELTLVITGELAPETLELAYKRIREANGATSAAVPTLTPVPVVSMQVELESDTSRVVLFARAANGGVGQGPLKIEHKITDERLHTLLSKKPMGGRLVVRAVSPRVTVDVTSAAVDLSTRAVKLAVEKIFPGLPLDQLLSGAVVVDRDGLEQAQVEARRSIEGSFEGDPAKLAPFMPVVLKRLDALFAQTTAPLYTEVAKLGGVTIWDRLSKAELAPNVRDDLVTASKEAGENRRSFQSAWDNLQVEAGKHGEAKSWHNSVCEQLKTSGGISAGYKMFSGKANYSFDKKYEQHDAGAQSRIDESFKSIKTAGSLTEATFSNYYKEFVGEKRWYETVSKALRLVRVTNLDVQLADYFRLGWTQQSRKALYEEAILVELTPSREIVADVILRHERFKQEQRLAWASQQAVNVTQGKMNEKLSADIADTRVAFNQADVAWHDKAKKEWEANGKAERQQADQHADAIVVEVYKKIEEKVGRLKSNGTTIDLGNGIEFRIHPDGSTAMVDTINRRVRWMLMGEWHKQ